MIYVEEVIIRKSGVERIVLVFDAAIIGSFALRLQVCRLQIFPDSSLTAENRRNGCAQKQEPYPMTLAVSGHFVEKRFFRTVYPFPFFVFTDSFLGLRRGEIFLLRRMCLIIGTPTVFVTHSVRFARDEQALHLPAARLYAGYLPSVFRKERMLIQMIVKLIIDAAIPLGRVFEPIIHQE